MRTSQAGQSAYRREFKAVLLATSAGLSAILCASAASAQSETKAQKASPTEITTDRASGANVTNTGDIIVTGSRIVRRDYSATSPIVTVDSNLLEKTSSVNLEANLNKLPQFAPALTQFNSDDIQSSANTTLGASTVSLRNLGSNRNLVLLDGRRGTPINGTGVIDINTIPSAAIQRVEIITGGASSTYGADAVGGVVNFILKKNYQGLEADGQVSLTQHGDGREYRLSAITGANFGDGKGNVLLGVERYDRDKILRTDRSWYRQLDANPNISGGSFLGLTQNYVTFNNNNPSQAAIDSLLVPKGATAGTVSPFTSFYINNDNTLFTNTSTGSGATYKPQVYGYTGALDGIVRKLTAAGTIAENNPAEVLSIPQDRWSMFAKAHFDFNENLSFFTQGYFAKTSTISVSQYAPATGGWGTLIPYGTGIYHGNSALNIPDSLNANGTTNIAYLAGGRFGLNCPTVGGCTNSQVFPVSAQLATLLNSRADPNAPWVDNQYLPQLGTRSTSNKNLSFQVLAGINGKVPWTRDWTYEIFGSHGETVAKTDQLGFGSVNRWRAVVSSPNYGVGFNATGNAAAPGNGFEGASATCTSGVSPFNQGAAWTPDCVAAVQTLTQNENRVQQTQWEGNIQGGLFNLPFGRLRFAAGAEYRKNSIHFESDSAATQGTSFLEGVIGIFPQGSTRGSTSVHEFYGELLVPVLKDLPFAKAVNLELGYRTSTYSSIGTVGTYKVNGDWSVTRWLTFRGGYQKASRAPNLGELFTAATQSLGFASDGDPCSQRNPGIPAGVGNYSATLPGTVVNGVAQAGNARGAAGAAATQNLCKQIMTAAAGTYYYDPANINTNSTAAGFSFAFTSLVGNPKLKQEDAKTYTIGGVMSSPFDNPWLRGFRASVDYYHVKLSNAIAQQGQDGVYRRCFSPLFNPSLTLNQYCALIQRDPVTGAPSTVSITYSNAGEVITDGIDGQIDWGVRFKDVGIGLPGSLGINLLVNYLNKFETTTDQGIIPLIDYSGTLGASQVGTDAGNYRWKAFTTVTYAVGPATLSLNWRHLPKVASTASATGATNFTGAPKYDIFDLSGTYALTRAIGIRFGVDNLFNKAPPLTNIQTNATVPTLSGGSYSPGYYDVIGRRFYVGAKFKF